MSATDDLIPHMHRVQTAERDMRDLGLVWQMIEASAAISCPDEVQTILPTLTQTRERFDNLQKRLVSQLGVENLAELGDDLVSKAQCAIDILVRNLFERTADVGFLATDDELRAFCAADAASRVGLRTALEARLDEYRAKYTVYDDLIVVDTAGAVLARLDRAAALPCSRDPIIAAALAGHSYVEQYATTDLAEGAALLYAHRIEVDGRAAGVLILRFRFADEMQRIFADLADERRQMALVLVDDARRVIATSDDGHVPLGTRLTSGPAGEVRLCSFGGRDYLAVTCPTRGYQSYRGPGWRAQAMVSLLTAFRGSQPAIEGDSAIALDNPELTHLQTEADEINRNLRRVVWNGRLMAGAQRGDQARLKAVLTQVHQAGSRTRERVADAIEELHRTSLGRLRSQAAELARLAADIMDRNLYERANDCRWWALSPVVRRVLAAPADAVGSAQLNAMLDHINGLYTVYTRLVAFDTQGVIRGASREDPARPLLGSQIDACHRDAVARLATSQQYAVSAFEPGALTEGAASYVYLAAVRSERGALVGGVAIVLNAASELHTMLTDVIGSRDALAAFVDAQGRVIACTDPAFATGATLPFVQGASVITHADAHHARASAPAGGYREFKHDDGYKNDVSAVVILHLGPMERRRASLHERTLAVSPVGRNADSVELAVFQVGASRYALPAASVLEACGQSRLVRTPVAHPLALGLLEVDAGSRPRLVQALCTRRLFEVGYPARANDGVMLVLRSPLVPDLPTLALRVDDLVTVIEVDRAHLQAAPAELRRHAPWVVSLLDSSDGAEVAQSMIQVLDPNALLTLIGRPAAAIAAPVTTADTMR